MSSLDNNTYDEASASLCQGFSHDRRRFIQAAARCLLDLLIQGGVGPGGPPTHHLENAGESGTGRLQLVRMSRMLGHHTVALEARSREGDAGRLGRRRAY